MTFTVDMHSRLRPYIGSSFHLFSLPPSLVPSLLPLFSALTQQHNSETAALLHDIHTRHTLETQALQARVRAGEEEVRREGGREGGREE